MSPIKLPTVSMWSKGVDGTRARAATRAKTGRSAGLFIGLLAFFLVGFIFDRGQAIAQSPKRFFETPQSGLNFASEEIRKLQEDELGNPAQLLVDQARTLWSQTPLPTRPTSAAATSHSSSSTLNPSARTAKSKACAGCHGQVETMKVVATRYPKVLDKHGLSNLEGRINICRTEQQGQAAWAYESPELLGMTALIASQSRGLSNQANIEAGAKSHFDAGQTMYYERMGQMNLSCAHCHEKNAGRRLLAEAISQGHPNAYPIYRLEWQATGSLHRRLRSCLNGVKAALWPLGSPEFLNLELFLAWRSQGLGVETPGVRR